MPDLINQTYADLAKAKAILYAASERGPRFLVSPPIVLELASGELKELFIEESRLVDDEFSIAVCSATEIETHDLKRIDLVNVNDVKITLNVRIDDGAELVSIHGIRWFYGRQLSVEVGIDINHPLWLKLDIRDNSLPGAKVII